MSIGRTLNRTIATTQKKCECPTLICGMCPPLSSGMCPPLNERTVTSEMSTSVPSGITDSVTP